MKKTKKIIFILSILIVIISTMFLLIRDRKTEEIISEVKSSSLEEGVREDFDNEKLNNDKEKEQKSKSVIKKEEQQNNKLEDKAEENEELKKEIAKKERDIKTELKKQSKEIVKAEKAKRQNTDELATNILNEYILYLQTFSDFQGDKEDGIVTYQKRRKD